MSYIQHCDCRFRVVAVYSNNDNKQGPNSRRFTLAVPAEHRPPAPLSGPVIVEARALSTSRIAIKWQVRELTLYFSPYYIAIKWQVPELILILAAPYINSVANHYGFIHNIIDFDRLIFSKSVINSDFTVSEITPISNFSYLL